MAETYWISFRLDDNATYADRYQELVETIKQLSGARWWVETSAFAVFQSERPIDEVARILKSTIDASRDILLLGMPDYKDGRLIGESADADIFNFIPFIKKA